MKFLKGFIVFFLIIIIVGGLGYIGYNFLYVDHSSMANMNGSQTASTDKSTDKSNTASNSQQNMQGMEGMQQGNSDQNQQNSSSQSATNQVGLNQANLILQNKDKLNMSTTALKEALNLLTVDPYAPSSSSSDNMSNMQQGSTNTNNVPTQSDSGNSTINIYPQNNNTVNVVPPSNGSGASSQTGAMPQNNTMQNMGTSYDANKMEKLHSGLFKISVGMSLLEQLNNELITQAEYASANTQNLIQYYSNQYFQTVQNKNKLNQALTYINEAANLVNINPYVSSNGLVYDKDRMNQIHQSVFKLAEGVSEMSLLNDDFTKQTILLSNTVQIYIDKANADNSSMASMNMSNGIFSNISMSSIVNILLIVFAVGLIFGIFGFIFSLLKAPTQKAAKKEEAA
jgi:hypothetical protein